MYKNKKTGKIGIAITIIVLIFLVCLTNLDIKKIYFAEEFANKLILPIQNGLTYLKNKVSKNNTFFENINELKQENEQLKEENENLSEKLRELEIIKAENNTLREYANLVDQYAEYTAIPAYIIEKDISNLSDTMVINVGTANGIKENMPVIAAEGLVGYVISVTENSAKVQPIINSASSTSGIISTTRDNVIIKSILGSNSTLKVTYIESEANIIEGDTIETSGIGGIYPKGILIGTVKEVINTKNITNRYAIIETAVNFSKLATVLVITNY